MRIENITDKQGQTRTDGRYPRRIGSEIEFFYYPVIGCVMYLYVKDKGGNPKEGTLRTSPVEKIERINTKLVVTTKNSIYTFSGDEI